MSVISQTQAVQDAVAIVDELAAAQKISAGNAKALKAKFSGAVRNVNDGDVDETPRFGIC